MVIGDDFCACVCVCVISLAIIIITSKTETFGSIPIIGTNKEWEITNQSSNEKKEGKKTLIESLKSFSFSTKQTANKTKNKKKNLSFTNWKVNYMGLI